MTARFVFALATLVCANACLPDETLELHPSTGATGGDAPGGSPQGGSGGMGGDAAGGGGGDAMCEHHVDCPGSAPWCELESGTCVVCPEGLELCGGSCVDRLRDAHHCGDCFSPCEVGEVCDAGTCACAAGLERCGDHCVDTGSDVDFCGDCLHACTAGQRCEQGGCHVGIHCEVAVLECPTSDYRTACVDPHLPPRCGGCAFACGPTETCVEGTCRALVPATPCEACPCSACEAQSETAACCDAEPNQDGPTCVEGLHCSQ